MLTFFAHYRIITSMHETFCIEMHLSIVPSLLYRGTGTITLMSAQQGERTATHLMFLTYFVTKVS